MQRFDELPEEQRVAIHRLVNTMASHNVDNDIVLPMLKQVQRDIAGREV